MHHLLSPGGSTGRVTMLISLKLFARQTSCTKLHDENENDTGLQLYAPNTKWRLRFASYCLDRLTVTLL